MWGNFAGNINRISEKGKRPKLVLLMKIMLGLALLLIMAKADIVIGGIAKLVIMSGIAIFISFFFINDQLEGVRKGVISSVVTTIPLFVFVIGIILVTYSEVFGEMGYEWRAPRLANLNGGEFLLMFMLLFGYMAVVQMVIVFAAVLSYVMGYGLYSLRGEKVEKRAYVVMSAVFLVSIVTVVLVSIVVGSFMLG